MKQNRKTKQKEKMFQSNERFIGKHLPIEMALKDIQGPISQEQFQRNGCDKILASPILIGTEKEIS